MSPVPTIIASDPLFRRGGGRPSGPLLRVSPLSTDIDDEARCRRDDCRFSSDGAPAPAELLAAAASAAGSMSGGGGPARREIDIDLSMDPQLSPSFSSTASCTTSLSRRRWAGLDGSSSTAGCGCTTAAGTTATALPQRGIGPPGGRMPRTMSLESSRGSWCFAAAVGRVRCGSSRRCPTFVSLGRRRSRRCPTLVELAGPTRGRTGTGGDGRGRAGTGGDGRGPAGRRGRVGTGGNGRGWV